MTLQTAQIADLAMEIAIDADRDTVWTALTENIGEWWPAEFYAGGAAGSRSFSLQACPGGLMTESWDGGGGVLWGTVVAVTPASQLQVLGSLFPSWGGPAQWFGTWDLEERGEGTMLRFSEHAVGQVSASGTEEKDRGWKFLCGHLKAHVEGTPPPAW